MVFRVYLEGFIKISLDQDSTTQLERVQSAGCDNVFSEKQSGTTIQECSGLAECLEYMREGDIPVITKIDRLANSVRDLPKFVVCSFFGIMAN